MFNNYGVFNFIIQTASSYPYTVFSVSLDDLLFITKSNDLIDTLSFMPSAN